VRQNSDSASKVKIINDKGDTRRVPADKDDDLGANIPWSPWSCLHSKMTEKGTIFWHKATEVVIVSDLIENSLGVLNLSQKKTNMLEQRKLY
jgi:hypothetical protein